MPFAQAEPWFSSEPDVMESPARLDSEFAPRAEEDVHLCIQSGSRRMVLDCQPLTYISGAGLRALLGMARTMQKANGVFVLCNLQPQVDEMLTASGLNLVIPVYSSRGEAFATFAA